MSYNGDVFNLRYFGLDIDQVGEHKAMLTDDTVAKNGIKVIVKDQYSHLVYPNKSGAIWIQLVIEVAEKN